MLLAPAFLLGLFAIGVPLWLHRFARETRMREPFSSLMLLEASQTVRSREHTLRYLLLLALRIALLALLVLAFTEPVIPWRAPPLLREDRTLHVIVLDTSLSMHAGQRWQRAIAQARASVDSLRAGDQAMLVTADSRVRVVHAPIDADAAGELRTALTTLRPGFGRLDYGMLMTGAKAWSRTQHALTTLHVITDLQQSASPLRFADLEPPAGMRLELIDVGGAKTRNLYIAAVGPSEQDANTLDVRVRGDAPGERRDVILSIDGTDRGRKRITATESTDARVAFAGLELGAGEHRATVTLDPNDALPQDDRYYAVLDRKQPRALVIGANSAGDDVAYFAAAVGALTNPRLAVERTGADTLGQRALPDYSALVVSDAGILSDDSAARIQGYLEAGGAVVMTLGPRAASLRKLPLSGDEPSRRALEAQGAANPIRVSAVDESHPMLRDAQGWRSVRFFRFVPVKPRPGDAVLIGLEGGAPLLIERRVGAGRLLVLTSPLDREWNDLAIHPLFVRFVAEATRYLTGATAARNTRVGSELPVGINGRIGAQIFDPHGQRVLALGATAGATQLVADQAGFYEVRGGGHSDWIAVNLDPRESDLARMPPASIEQWQRLQTTVPRTSGVSARAASAAAQPKPIWPWLLLIAVTLAFLEPLVANFHLHVRRAVAS